MKAVHLDERIIRKLRVPAALAVAACGIFALSAFAEDRSTAASPESSALADILTVFERGGPVMWSIAAVLLIGIVMGLERILDLTRRRHCPRDFEKDVTHVADARGMDAGISLCREKPSSLARCLSAALTRHGAPLAQIESAVRHETRMVRYVMLKNTRVIGWLAAIAPIQALLAILLGMLNRLGSPEASRGATTGALIVLGFAESLPAASFALITALLLLGIFFVTRARANDLAHEIQVKSTDAILILDRKARQSIRLIEDIEEKIKTESMIKVPDLSAEFDEHAIGSSIKTAVTTHAGLPLKDSNRGESKREVADEDGSNPPEKPAETSKPEADILTPEPADPDPAPPDVAQHASSPPDAAQSNP